MPILRRRTLGATRGDPMTLVLDDRPSVLTTPGETPPPSVAVPAGLDEARQTIAVRDAQISELKRLVAAKETYIATVHQQLGELRDKLQDARSRNGSIDAVTADRDVLDAANGRLVERIRQLEKQLAEADA